MWTAIARTRYAHADVAFPSNLGAVWPGDDCRDLADPQPNAPGSGRHGERTNKFILKRIGIRNALRRTPASAVM